MEPKSYTYYTENRTHLQVKVFTYTTETLSHKQLKHSYKQLKTYTSTYTTEKSSYKLVKPFYIYTYKMCLHAQPKHVIFICMCVNAFITVNENLFSSCCKLSFL